MIRELQSRYPNLFREAVHGAIRSRFELIEEAPPEHRIANINIVPRIGNCWLVIQLEDGRWEVPGGTLEPGEAHMDAIRRELAEEAGAELQSFRLFGAWSSHSMSAVPYRSHLPHPDFYRLVGVGTVRIVGEPEAPADGEQVANVECVPIDVAVDRFHSSGRRDLAELYELAQELDRLQP